jgi:XTP/dITP diphosphohydrolase
MVKNEKLVAATGNLHKLFEIRTILEPLGFTVISKEDAGSLSDDPEETGDTFEANALIKARALAEELGCAVIADDSGLEVDALDGLPGVYSARFAQGIKDEIPAFARMTMEVGATATKQSSPDELNCLCLLSLMKNIPVPKRTARFVCAIVLLRPGFPDIIVRGTCEGKIAGEAKGDSGFGYDPLFIPKEQDGTEYTFAELGQDKKDAMSHRANALRCMKSVIESTAPAHSTGSAR